MLDLEIRCCQSSSFARLSEFKMTGRGAYDEALFVAELRSDALSARAQVPDIVSTAWVDFFDDLAAQRKAWAGTRNISSTEKHLSFTARCDPTGHVELAVRLRESPLYKGSWSAEVLIQMELGQLDALAKRARTFFAA